MVHATEHEPATQNDETGKTIDETTLSWGLPAAGSTIFDFDYTNGRDELLRLYDKGTRRQWVASDRIDWSVDVDFENPLGVPDESIMLVGTPYWEKMNERERGEVRRNQVAWQFSQFLHGEQGALMCASKIVNTVPTIDAKFYAATQVIDEARHVEVFSRYLHEKLDLVYPLNNNLRSLLNDALTDSRWDMTYLAMQVLIEGLALAAFSLIRQQRHRPARPLDQRVRDAGRGPPRDVRTAGVARLLPAAHPGRARRTRGVLRRRVLPHARPLPRRRGLGAARPARRRGGRDREARRAPADVPRLLVHADRSGPARHRSVGSAYPRAFEDMGVLGFADADIEQLISEDEAIAEEIDQERLQSVRAVADTASG